MKTFKIIIISLCVFSSRSFGQNNVSVTPVVTTKNASSSKDIEADGDLVIKSYYVVETINMVFGKRVTKYEVSKLDMIDTYDLGPNNTRTITPIYKKRRVAKIEMLPKYSKDNVTTTIPPIKISDIAVAENQKYIFVHPTDTYKRIIDQGYVTADMLIKVADECYFDGKMNEAVWYYGKLLKVSPEIEASYYYRYAQSLRRIGQKEKADKIMTLFESKMHKIKLKKNN